jgi:hypothetical protein
MTSESRCQECGCTTGGGTFCYQHAPYTVYPLKDGTFLRDRNGQRDHLSFDPPAESVKGYTESPVATIKKRLMPPDEVRALKRSGEDLDRPHASCPRCGVTNRANGEARCECVDIDQALENLALLTELITAEP